MDWYDQEANQVGLFELANGQTLGQADVQSLVQAMSSWSGTAGNDVNALSSIPAGDAGLSAALAKWTSASS